MILLGLMLSAWMVGSAAAQGRVATVDLEKTFKEYWKTKQSDAAWNDRRKDLEKEHAKLRDDWKHSKEEYGKLLSAAQEQAVSDEERDKRKQNAEAKLKEIKELEDTIAQFERQARTTLDELRMRLRNKLLDDIRAVINAKSKVAGYALVLDTAATTPGNTPVVVYNSGDNDITEAVLQQLNANAPADTSGSIGRPADTKSAEDNKDAKK